MEVYEFLDEVLLEHVNADVGIELLLGSMFENNQEISATVPYEEVLHSLGNQVISHFPRRNPSILQVLKKLIVVNDTVVPLAKTRLVEMFRDSHWRNMIADEYTNNETALQNDVLNFSRSVTQIKRKVFRYVYYYKELTQEDIKLGIYFDS